MTLDLSGVIQSATESIAALLPVKRARDLCGKRFASLLVDPSADPVKDSIVAGRVTLECARENAT